MRHRQSSSTVQEYLDDFVIVPMGGQDQGCNVGGESGRVRGKRFPTLKRNILRKLSSEICLIRKESSLLRLLDDSERFPGCFFIVRSEKEDRKAFFKREKDIVQRGVRTSSL